MINFYICSVQMEARKRGQICQAEKWNMKALSKDERRQLNQ